MATRCPNIYGSLAVANMFIHNQPRHFAEIMANLLFWIGPDRIIHGQRSVCCNHRAVGHQHAKQNYKNRQNNERPQKPEPLKAHEKQERQAKQ